MKLIRKGVTITLVVVIFIVGTCFLLYSSYIQPMGSKNEEIIEIKQGATSREIGRILYENKLIKNEKFFLFYLKLNGINKLQAGTYKLSGTYPLKKIVEIIENGDIYTDG